MTSEKLTLEARLVALANTRAIVPVLLLVEVLESTVLPLPYEAIFIALCLAAPHRVWLFLLVTMIGSVLAACMVYALGAGLAGPVAQYFDAEAAIATYSAAFEENGPALIFLGAFTPVPASMITLAAGASGYPFATFMALFIVGRFVRFAGIALLLHLFGDTITSYWQRLPPRLRRVLYIALVVTVIAWPIMILMG